MTTFPRVAVELPVAADRSAAQSLAEQITAQLREALADGRLAAGERLPSSRALATTLGVSRTVVTTAYTQLFAEGWLDGRHGSGTYVADGAPGIPAAGAAGVRAGSGARAPAPRLGAGAARGAAAAVPRLDGARRPAGCPRGPAAYRCGRASRGPKASTGPRGAGPGGTLLSSCRVSPRIPWACPACARLSPGTCGAAAGCAARPARS